MLIFLPSKVQNLSLKMKQDRFRNVSKLLFFLITKKEARQVSECFKTAVFSYKGILLKIFCKIVLLCVLLQAVQVSFY